MRAAVLRSHVVVVPALLVATGVLAVSSLVGDSATFDEVSHLTAGASYLRTGDFRLAPDHPPLGKIWCAWPLMLTSHRWPAAHDEDWVLANVFPLGAKWLFELNDGQPMLVIGRVMMTCWLLATCAAVYFAARHLFGPGAGLLALTLACFCPSLLAHGRLVTTDLPITLFALLSLWSFARFLRRPSILSLTLAGLALAGAALSKFSWPLVLPALGGIAIVDVVRAGGRSVSSRRPLPREKGSRQSETAATATLRRVLIAAAALGAMLLITWGCIWTCYAWRSGILVIPNRPLAPAEDRNYRRTAQRFAQEWRTSLYKPNGAPREGLAAAVLRGAASSHVLPDAYLIGVASTLQSTSARMAYLMGDYSTEGWRSYFPIAFAIKTPIATMALVAAGLLTLVLRRVRPNDAALAVGLGVFVCVYAGYVVLSNLNIGHRHLLPIYPPLYVLAGAGAVWTGRTLGRATICAALAWLVGANLWIHPHYLAYFNELIGGSARGHLYLADSNLDWGQDLLRLAAYHRRHPEESLKLAYFGSAPPTYYVTCSMLPSFFDFPPPASLTAGTYVVSATHWTGVYLPPVRDDFWTRERLARFAEIRRAAASAMVEQAGDGHDRVVEEARLWSAFRLLNRLRHRRPDARIGTSLFVYKLDDAELARLLEE